MIEESKRRVQDYRIQAAKVRAKAETTISVKEINAALHDADLWERMATRAVRLFPNDSLIEDLRMPTYSYLSGSQKVVILSKDLMRKIIVRSPDFGDALYLTFAGTGALLSGRTSQWGSFKGALRRNLAGVV